MRHCCQFKADEIYYLEDSSLFTERKLSIGFCPICYKPVAELVEVNFLGVIERTRFSGIKANEILIKLKEQIKYSASECNYLKIHSKPYGWKFGINKTVKIKGKEYSKQYAKDFYGNKELIKVLQK